MKSTVLIPVLLVSLGACQEQAEEWRTRRYRVDGVRVVETTSGSAWGTEPSLERELQIGQRDGPDAYVFGFVRDVAVGPDGMIVVHDAHVPALRVYGRDGRYVKDLGRAGAGPGEYSERVLGVAVTVDGEIRQWDFGNARINRYTRTGEILPSWRVASSTLTVRQAFWLDSAGYSYVLVIVSRRGERGQMQPRNGAVRLDPLGQVVDTLAPPQPDPPDLVGGFFHPTMRWTVNWAGSLVHAYGAQYEISVRDSVNPLRIIRRVEAVRTDPEERSEREAYSRALRAREPPHRQWPLRDEPSTKPYVRDLRVGLDGRIWVHRFVRGTRGPARGERAGVSRPRWREPTVYDVFEADGTFLGSVSVPERLTIHESRGDVIWGVERGRDDEQYVVRYRMRF